MNNSIINVRIYICLGEHQTTDGVKSTTVIGCWHKNVMTVFVDEAAVARAAKRLGGDVADVRYFDSPAAVKVIHNNGEAVTAIKCALPCA